MGAKMNPTDRSTTEDWIAIAYPKGSCTMEEMRDKSAFLATLREIRQQKERKLGCDKFYRGEPCSCHWCLIAPFENLPS